jgi:cell division protein FtsX
MIFRVIILVVVLAFWAFFGLFLWVFIMSRVAISATFQIMISAALQKDASSVFPMISGASSIYADGFNRIWKSIMINREETAGSDRPAEPLATFDAIGGALFLLIVLLYLFGIPNWISQSFWLFANPDEAQSFVEFSSALLVVVVLLFMPPVFILGLIRLLRRAATPVDGKKG